MNSLIWLAVVLIIAWIVLKFFLAITSVVLHVVWVLALIFLAIWLFKKFTT